MVHNRTPLASDRPTKGRSLRWKILVAVNAAVVAILIIFMVWDYTVEWSAHLREKRTAMDEQAKTLLPAVLRLSRNLDDVQTYIDRVCAQMQEGTSPGHHIVVQIGGHVLQARPHQRQSPEMERAVLAAASRPTGSAGTNRGRIIVGQARQAGAAVYVSEYLFNIERIIRAQIARRIFSVLLLGVVLAVVLNLLIDRLITRPLGAVVGAVRRLSTGELGVQVPSANTAELAFLADEFNSMSAALAAADRARQEQMHKARRIQQRLIPSDIEDIGVKAAWIYEPATEVAGDYFDIRQTEADLVLFCVADVTGHGVPAAMVAAMIKTLFTSVAAQSSDPQAILTVLNEGLSAATLEEDFASMIVVAWDPAGHRLRYASAGHEPAYLIRPGGPTRTLDSTGPLLGILADATWQTVELEVEAGDRLVIVTDGLSETTSAGGELFGRDRLRALLEQGKTQPLEVWLREAIDRVVTFRGQSAQADDMTILAVEF